MKHVHKQVLIWYSPSQMYALVTDVARYPEFLPWCASAKVLEQHEGGMTAQLGLSMAGVRQQFTTRNAHVAGEKVNMTLVDGPFSALQGDWVFAPIGDGSQQACKVTLDLRYSFSSGALSALVGPVFDKIAATLVDAFVKRAEQVYAH
jgi:ribosome-associated toxin RatA of RatAB toxin-antitoxin module